MFTKVATKVQNWGVIPKLKDESGRLGGYVLAWFLGVPASLLIVIFLIRGH
jgi:hypothetical protein